MFVESELTWTIAVKPCDLKSGLHIQRALLRKLLADFNKLKCSEKHGYYICVTTLEDISEGKIWEGKGCVAYKVRFRCLTYKPQKHEKVFAVVTGELQEKGAMCSFGPIENMFLSTKLMKDQYTFVGASESKPVHFKGKDGSIIESGSVLRVEILGVKFNSLTRAFDTVCSVSGDYLGVDGRTWEDKSTPATANWGANDPNGAEAGAWGSDTPAENDAGGWGASPVRESGGWGAAPAEKSKNGGGWDTASAKTTSGWDDASPKKADKGGSWGVDPANESAGGWDSPPIKKTNDCGTWDATPATVGNWGASPGKNYNSVAPGNENSGRWDATPAEKSNGGAGWGSATLGKKDVGSKNTAKSKANGNWETASEKSGGWGSSPTKKSKSGGWDSSPVEKESTDMGSWGDPPTKSSVGVWDSVEVGNTGGGWGD
ncbi:hypothetical protein MPTK1_2g19500 [Marchantia polymorpha subsp. ruderalis]|uniref:RNA polymerase Rpb7-like N-terminal domain-containing protein n=2 Tax=Marchantia polymorpha TaxID=3197 RepID=A0A176VZ16_MARPO|nr:hypothetical protein AXG93_812s1160 [Marchantia polymorpha subsp. ruderalis]PTQ37846.1 hypothetical protein MARPO_0055s0101 [Marchantia polymorpha]BBN02944.1 hypothetical protein Mp_2g19500 [Marchantia polymorpha subsp. ruderalis]|eukprot:PTQ37846.1 hypothetical protein MARPO_0055s0101 [Marchantia polymorpha]